MTRPFVAYERFDAERPFGASGAAQDVSAQRARAEAYAEGFAAGQAAASAKESAREANLARSVAIIEKEIGLLPERVNAEALGALRAILKAVFPALAARGFAEEAAARLAALGPVRSGARLAVAAPPSQADALKRALHALMSEGAAEVTVDASLSVAAARFEWDGGGGEFDMERACAQCLGALEEAIEAKHRERQ